VGWYTHRLLGVHVVVGLTCVSKARNGSPAPLLPPKILTGCLSPKSIDLPAQSVRNPPGSTQVSLMFHSGFNSWLKASVKPSTWDSERVSVYIDQMSRDEDLPPTC